MQCDGQTQNKILKMQNTNPIAVMENNFITDKPQLLGNQYFTC